MKEVKCQICRKGVDERGGTLLPLWLTYMRSDDLAARLEARNSLLTALLPLLRAMARKTGTRDDFDELIHDALLRRILNQLDRYDPKICSIEAFVGFNAKLGMRTVFRERVERESKLPITLETDCFNGRDHEGDQGSIANSFGEEDGRPMAAIAEKAAWVEVRKCLNDREYRVIWLIFGEGEENGDVARMMKLDRCTISIVQAAAIAKLKAAPRVLKLLLEATEK